MEDNNQYVQKPDNNMALAIFTTLCCCMPLGIVAIIKASKVNDLYYMKQYDAASIAAADAKKYATYGLIGGAIVWGAYILLYAIGIFAIASGY